MVGTFVMPQTGTTYSGPLRDSLEISWCHGAEEAALGGVEQVGETLKSAEEVVLLGLNAVGSREPHKALGLEM